MAGDPVRPLRAASLFGPLVARGLVRAEEALAALTAAARRQAPSRDARGMRARLAHALLDAAAEHERARLLAHARILKAVLPLLDAWADAATIRAAAARAAGDVFAPDELARRVEAIVRGRIG